MAKKQFIVSLGETAKIDLIKQKLAGTFMAATTAAQIKSMYEGLADTNAFTDADKTKVASAITSQLTAVQIKTLYESVANSFTNADKTKLASAITAQLTAAQVKSMYEGLADTNAFTDTEKAKVASAITSAMKFNVATEANIPAGTYSEGDIGQIRDYNGTKHEAIALYTDSSNWVFFEQESLKQDMGDIHTFVAGKDLATKLMELKLQVDKNSHSTSTSNAPIKYDAQINVDGAAGGFIMADFVNPIANPANPGKDIEDGSSHYVQFLEKDHAVPVETTWIWLTQNKAGGGTETKRLWTNTAKSKAVGGVEMETWIRVKALIQIQKDTDEWFVRDVHLPAQIPAAASKSLVTKGVITDIHHISEMGIYEGTDVANAPAQGHIIVEAFQDANGDLDLTMKDQTSRRYEGGKPKNGIATWHHVAADHLFGTTDPLDTIGDDGDLYFKTA